MKDLFPHHYRRTDEEFEEIFKDCIFVFDANMLLNLYRYPMRAREDLFNILQKISEQERQWLPFQAAVEFQENRLSVIADQKRKFGQVRKIIANIQRELQNQLDDLQLRKRHSSIDPDVLVKEINTAFQKYISQLDRLESEQPDVHQEDRIRSKIDGLFEGKVGKPFSQAELDIIYTEGNNRYKAKQPPGYADEAEKKGTYTFYGDLLVKREFGDLIVWKEIIRYINETKPKGLVFVTDDNKEDWWLELSGKTIGPRPELLAELYAKTSLSSFYIYNSERFMEIASQYLGVPIGKDSIEQVKIIQGELRVIPIRQQAKQRAYILQLYDNKCQICGFDTYAQAAHIVPRIRGGESDLANMLVLCPNHHTMFDAGVFSIDDNFRLIGIAGELTLHPNHQISLESLKYHRENKYRAVD